MKQHFSISRLIAETKLYAAYDALLVGKDYVHPTLRPEHDALYRYALDRGLARWLALTFGKRFPKAQLPVYEVQMSRVQWWPANGGTSPAPNLVFTRTDPFDNDWTKIRNALEFEPGVRRRRRRGGSKGPIWHDDPALFIEHPSGGFLCRCACTGHEGYVYYLAYEREEAWVAQLESAGLRLADTGEAAYRRIVPEPGKIAFGMRAQKREAP